MRLMRTIVTGRLSRHPRMARVNSVLLPGWNRNFTMRSPGLVAGMRPRRHGGRRGRLPGQAGAHRRSFPPGGPADALARTVGDAAGALGQPVVVDNRPGAAATSAWSSWPRRRPTATRSRSRRRATLPSIPACIATCRTMWLAIAPVTVIAAVPNILVVNPQVPARTWRSSLPTPRPIRADSTLIPGGSGAHLAGEFLKSSAGIDVVHVPFNGIAPAVTAVVAGDVQIMFAGAIGVAAGERRAITRARRREPEAHRGGAGAATLDESGLPGSTSRPGTASSRRRARRRPSSSSFREIAKALTTRT